MVHRYYDTASASNRGMQSQSNSCPKREVSFDEREHEINLGFDVKICVHDRGGCTMLSVLKQFV